MKIVFSIIFVLALYGTASYVRFKFILSRAHLHYFTQNEKRFGSGENLRYVAAGDSTAVGEGASSFEQTYPYKIAEYLSENHLVEYKNVAVSGSTTRDLIDNQLESIIEEGPDIVTISIGANDITHWKSKVEIIQNYKTIIAELTQKTKAKIYITNVPRFDSLYLLPWSLRVFYDSRAKLVNKSLINPNPDRVKFIDIHSVMVRNSSDQFHPSDEGYKFWTQAFLSQIK